MTARPRPRVPSTRRSAVHALAVAAVVVLGAAPAVANQVVVAELPRPTLLYSFDDTSSSVVANSGAAGSALDGTIENSASLQRGSGAVSSSGASGVFPGATRNPASTAPSVEIPTGLFDGANALTVSTWIKWDGRFADELPWAYIVGSDALPANNWGVYYVPTEGGEAKAVANSGTEVKAAGAALTPGAWTYITTVVTGTSVSYYVNGALVRSEPVVVDVSALAAAGSTRSGLIGRVPWSGEFAAYFPGEFDEFAVYRQALTAQQVAALFAGYTGSITSVEQSTFAVSTPQGVPPQLPASVRVHYSGGSDVDVPITWAAVPARAYAVAGVAFDVAGSLPGWDGRLTARVQVQQRGTETVSVDFSQDTGAFRGGATGTLYGLGDEQSPTQALVNGAAMTNISQKPPFGTQHPGGDVFNVEKTFFDKWGKDLYVYAQDFYPDWPYHGAVRPGDELTYTRSADGTLSRTGTPGADGTWDYLQILEVVVDEVATKAADPTKYTFIPFNEPDWIWYRNGHDEYNRYLIQGGQPDSFTPGGVSDWQAAWKVITDTYARHGLARPKIAGSGDSVYMGVDNMRTFLTAAKLSSTVPDVFVWHELGGYVWLPDRMVGYRQAATQAGIATADIPEVNITEWGASNDMSSPASLLRWFSSFEAAKVDAQTAYWTASGTMSDNQAKVNSANGGWWLFNWYGDMNGSRTVKVTDGERRAIAAVDARNKRAQVIYGGVATGKDARVVLSGLDRSVFGDSVDIEVRETRVSGTDGEAGTPRLVAAADSVAVAGASITVPATDSYSAYQVIITPATARDVTAELADQAFRTSIEAEDVSLTSAQVRTSPQNGYRASSDRDVWGFDSAASRADWTVEVDRPGAYRFEVIGATPGVPVNHALFVDGANPQTVRYGANAMKPSQVQTVARGSASVVVQLTAGSHTLSLRTSLDGTTLLPNAGYSRDGARGVTLDRFVLTRIGDTVDTETVRHPASTFRLAAGAALQWTGAHAGWAALSTGARADLYPATSESGYYDLTSAWSGVAGSTLRLVVNGRTAATFRAAGTDERSRVRVHLPEGISEVELFGTGAAAVREVTVTRAVEGDASIVRVEAEDLAKVRLAGTATTTAFGTQPTDGIATDGSGTGYVKGLGITDRVPAHQGTMTVARAAGFDTPGEYDAVVHFSNDSIEGTHSYNPQVVDLGLQAKEQGSDALVGRSTFRYTYLASNFWEAVMPLSLTSAHGAIEFGNTRETLWIDEGPTGSASDDVAVPGYAIAPNVDWIAFAPFVLPTPDTTPVSVTAKATSSTAVNAAGWYRSTVTVTFADNSPGATVEYRLGVAGAWTAATAPVKISTDGTTTVYYRATRGSSPVPGSAGSLVVKLDRLAPVSSVRVDPASGSAVAGRSVTARFSAKDVTSGVAAIEHSLDAGRSWQRTPSVSVVRVGTHRVLYRAVDRAGNTEKARSLNLTVTEPTGPAAMSIRSADSRPSQGWYQRPVTVTLTAPRHSTATVQYRIDAGRWVTYRGPLVVTTTGVSVIQHRRVLGARVVAGSLRALTVKVDRTRPVTTVRTDPASGSGTTRKPVTVSLRASDSGSGVSEIRFRIDGGGWIRAGAQLTTRISTVGTHVLLYGSADRAGNLEQVRSLPIVVRPSR